MPSYEIRNVHVEFPFPAYDCQILYMEKVIASLQTRQHALLESPTGTGKTLSLLCSTLAWLDGHKKEYNQPQPTSSKEKIPRLAPQILYASRTHSQLNQAVRELKKSGIRVKMAILASRDQMCCHPQVSKLASVTQKNNVCRKLTKTGKCHYSLQLDAMKRGGLKSTEIMDIEDLALLAHKDSVCPYFYAREGMEDADILFVPYNYVVDSMARHNQDIKLQNSIIIFDEGHNIEKICGDSTSFDISSADFATAIDECDGALELGENMFDFDKTSIITLKKIILSLEKELITLPLTEKNRRIEQGEFIYSILAKASITIDTWEHVNTLINYAVEVITQESFIQQQPHQAIALNNIQSALRVVFPENGIEDMMTNSLFYKVHIQETVAQTRRGTILPKIRVLSLWCFNSGIAMREMLSKGVRNIIITSGTLSPLPSFASDLQIDFQHQLENVHVISQDQLFVGIVPKGPSGCTLSSSFKQRSEESYLMDLGNALVNFCRMIPEGVLVFFPSYGWMDQCLEFWKKKVSMGKSIWERLEQLKLTVVEPRDKLELNSLLTRYYGATEDNGGVLFAVCRGKVSEGVDFSDNKGRGVIVTGIPYPAMMDPKVDLKRRFLDEMKQRGQLMSISGNEWYQQQASRAVNQAIGRVIRHRNDYGAILLCDDRFLSQQNYSQLPLWVRPFIRKFNNFGEAQSQLQRFFKANDGKRIEIQRLFGDKENEAKSTAELKKNIENEEKENNERKATVKKPTNLMKLSLAKDHQKIDIQSSKSLSEALDVFSIPISKAPDQNAFFGSLNDKAQNNFAASPVLIESDSEVVEEEEQEDTLLFAIQEFTKLAKRTLSATDYAWYCGTLAQIRNKSISLERGMSLIGKKFKNFELLEKAFCNLLPIGLAAMTLQKKRSTLNPIESCQKKKGIIDLSDDSNSKITDAKDSKKGLMDRFLIPKSNACIICFKEPNKPFKAVCKHVACYMCWLDWLKNNSSCPFCKQEKIRMRDLEKIFFK